MDIRNSCTVLPKYSKITDLYIQVIAQLTLCRCWLLCHRGLGPGLRLLRGLLRGPYPFSGAKRSHQDLGLIKGAGLSMGLAGWGFCFPLFSRCVYHLHHMLYYLVVDVDLFLLVYQIMLWYFYEPTVDYTSTILHCFTSGKGRRVKHVKNIICLIVDNKERNRESSELDYTHSHFPFISKKFSPPSQTSTH